MAKSKYLLIGAPVIGLLMIAGVWVRGGGRPRGDDLEKEVRKLRAQVYAMELDAKEKDRELTDLRKASVKSVTGPERMNGVLPAGDDIGSGDARTLTIGEALRVCRATPGCKGFTYPGADPAPKGRVKVFLKSTFRLVAAEGWWSYKMPVTEEETEVPPDLGYPLYLKYKHLIEADYNVTDVALKGPEKFMELWPEYEYPAEPAFRYPAAGAGHVTLAVSPRVVFKEGTVSLEDAKEVVEKSKGMLSRSLVANDQKHLNESGVKNVRTSSGAWLNDDFPPAKRLRDVIQSWTGVDRSQFESLQILRYQSGQKYGSHVDYFHPAAYGKKSWNRMATVITFLSTVHTGGESNFPIAHTLSTKSTNDCTHGLRVHPTTGHSVLFYSMRPDLNFDHFSLHGGCPVGEGEEKWVAIQWLHIGLPNGLPPESL